MRVLLLLITLSIGLLATTAQCNDTVGNANELRERLLQGRVQARLEAIMPEHGCGPSGCRVDVEQVSIQQPNGEITGLNGSKIVLKMAGNYPDQALPELDWDPIGSYKVFRSGKRWGTCLEFGHQGLGKSGHFQRWSSLVLIPWKGVRPGAVAYRIAGYWLGCEFLAESAKSGEMVVPSIEPKRTEDDVLQVIWHYCTLKRCIDVRGTQTVSEVDDSDDGELVINTR